jgi:hypothetical protein
MEQCREHDKSSLNIAPEGWCPSCLRASTAALKAENEAAVKNMAALQSELAAFKNWQPSDPGTKEAMEIVKVWEERDWVPLRANCMDHLEALKVLATSYRAAMVRLEEAEKEINRLMTLIREVKI